MQELRIRSCHTSLKDLIEHFSRGGPVCLMEDIDHVYLEEISDVENKELCVFNTCQIRRRPSFVVSGTVLVLLTRLKYVPISPVMSPVTTKKPRIERRGWKCTLSSMPSPETSSNMRNLRGSRHCFCPVWNLHLSGHAIDFFTHWSWGGKW